MDTLPHIFCARCGGVILSGFPNPKQIEMIIAGKHYHYYCGQKVQDDWIDENLKGMKELLDKRKGKNQTERR